MTKLYFPQEKDIIIGIVDSKLSGEYYKININAAQPAVISNLEFKNVVKRNKQVLQDGDAIYAKVLEVIPDPLLSCKETIGVIERGMILKVDCHFCTVFEDYASLITTYTPFEYLIGVNGYIYINHELPETVVILYNLIKKGEYLTVKEFSTLVNNTLK